MFFIYRVVFDKYDFFLRNFRASLPALTVPLAILWMIKETYDPCLFTANQNNKLVHFTTYLSACLGTTRVLWGGVGYQGEGFEYIG